MPRDASSCVRAVVRVRPLLAHELDKGEEDCCEVQDANSILIQSGAHSNQWRKYAFDACLPSERSQKHVFQECGVTNLLDSAILGYSATVLAYGQTGSGKTYTMTGRLSTDATGRGGTEDLKRDDGLIMRSAKRLFKRIGGDGELSDANFSVSASFTEIYNAPGAVNECICDLLSPEPAGKNLQVRHSQKHGFYVSDLCVVDCRSFADVRSVLEAGLQNRRVGAHALNKDSSRSHALFTLYIDSECTAPGEAPGSDQRTKRFGKITFVDLAGSERLKESLSEGHARKETQAINKSLFTLGQVISQLAQGKAEKHVPYRNSKLTQLLQESFGGESLCLMVTCISPAAVFAEESLNSLNYAQKAMNIQNRPVIRLDERQQVLHDLRAENAALRREVEAYRAKFGPLSPSMLIHGAVEPSSHTLDAVAVPAIVDVPSPPTEVVRADSTRNADAVSAPQNAARERSSRPPSGEPRDTERRRRSSGSKPGVSHREPVAPAASRGRSEPPLSPHNGTMQRQQTTEQTPEPSPPPPIPSAPAPNAVQSPPRGNGSTGYAMAAARRRDLEQKSRVPNAETRARKNSARTRESGAARSLPPLPSRTPVPGSASSTNSPTAAGRSGTPAAAAPEAWEGDHIPAASARPNVQDAEQPDDRKSLRAANGLDQWSPSSGRGSVRSQQAAPLPSSRSKPPLAEHTAPLPAESSAASAAARTGKDGSAAARRTIPVIAAPPSGKVVAASATAATAITAADAPRVAEMPVTSTLMESQRIESNRRSQRHGTKTQLERLDQAHWSEWQFRFNREAEKGGGAHGRCTEASDGRDSPSRGSSVERGRSKSDSSSCSSEQRSPRRNAAGSTVASSSPPSLESSSSRMEDMRQSRERQLAMSMRSNADGGRTPGSQNTPAATPKAVAVDLSVVGEPGFKRMALSELNTKLSSMQLATTALLQENDGAKALKT